MQGKGGVIETAILTPEGAGPWTRDRQQLWERVEARERRRDAQLAQELEINLPRELDDAENWRLVTDFARERLVAYGRVCDIAFHKGRAADGGEHPHAHILMPLRSLAGEGFGEKHPDCDWRNFLGRRDVLGELREDWATFARVRAAELGIDLGPEWDHRSLADRGIELEGQPKLGATAQRLEGEGTVAERTAAQLAARQRNGTKLLADPCIALEALTQRQSTFSVRDLAAYVFRNSDHEQYPHIMARAQALAIDVGRDRDGQPRFSTQAMIELESRMVANAGILADRPGHVLSARQAHRAATGERLSAEQAEAAEHLLTEGDLACLIGYAGAGKSTLLHEARLAWEAQGYRVRGAALSGIAAESLQQGSGIDDARTIASFEYAWQRGRDQLTNRDVLVIDEAGMVGSRTLDDVDALNIAAREELRAAGDLGPEDVRLETNRGTRQFAEGDRVLFRRNDRGLGVRNGTLGTVAEIAPGRIAATLDDGSRVELDPSVYRDLDHGYAVTVHKAQGVTVDRAHVLATRGFDRHLAYVACSRHREGLSMVASREAFGGDAELTTLLGRERAKDTTLDYREGEERRALAAEGLATRVPSAPERPITNAHESPTAGLSR